MLQIRELRKSFKSAPVLKGLSLEIRPGERLALVGQNGCGKTTLIRCILGLYQFEGKISIFNSDIQREREEALKNVAFVPQAPPPLKNTVREMISLVGGLSGFSEQKVRTLADELGLDLTRILNTPFKSLSGGMKQKLLIACALAREPKILIMDEPSANLDPQARAVFFRLLSKLPPETTMLLTSHRIDELSGIVSRVIEIDEGVVSMDDVVEGRGNDILTEQQECELRLTRIPASVKQGLKNWGLRPVDTEELIWKGTISSADSFRFHATLTRWSGIIGGVQIQTIKHRKDDYEKIFEPHVAPLYPADSGLSGIGFADTSRAVMGQRTLRKVQDDID